MVHSCSSSSNPPMEIFNLIPHIEALVFASDRPLGSMEITDLLNQAFGFMEDKIVVEQVDAAIEGMVEKYQTEFYPFEVRLSGGGWQFLTKKEFHKTVAQLNGEKFLKRLSPAALETLAIVAYKQPVTKGEIESIRGVSSDYAVQKLLEKELVIITGRNEKLPGHPLVYATSKNFMDYFGINSAEDLPKIREVLSAQMVLPTEVHAREVEQSELLAVSDGGELIGASPMAITETDAGIEKEAGNDQTIGTSPYRQEEHPKISGEITPVSYSRHEGSEENNQESENGEQLEDDTRNAENHAP